MSTFQKLPIELLKPIFRFLKNWELAPVALTCQDFASVAKEVRLEDTDITIAPSLFQNQSQLYTEFFQVVEGEAGRALTRPEDLSPDDEYSFNKLQQWAVLARDKSAKEVSGIRIGFSACSESGSTIKSVMVSKVIGNLSADRLTKLSTEYKWMDVEEIRGLSALTDLELCIHSGDLEQDPVVVKLPNVRKLKIKVSDDRTGQQPPGHVGAKKFLELVCSIISQLPTLEVLDIEAMSLQEASKTSSEQDAYTIRAKCLPPLLQILNKLVLPGLREFGLRLNPTGMGELLRLKMSGEGKPRLLSFRHVFGNFVTRHADQLQRITWVGGFGIPPGSPDEVLPIPVFPNASKVQISAQPGFMSTPSNQDYDWCDKLRREESCGKALREINIETWYQLGYNVNVDANLLMFWPMFTGMFENLTILRYSNLRVDQSTLQRQTGTPNPFMAIFGVYTEDNLVDFLPQSIQEIHVRILSWDRYMSWPLTVMKDGMKTLFQGCLSLNSTDVAISGSGNPMSRTQRFTSRRQAVDCTNPQSGRKLSLWSTELMHNLDDYPEDHKGAIHAHPVLVDYKEYALEEKGYKGTDGASWRLSEEEIQHTRACRFNGRGGCDRYLKEEIVRIAQPQATLDMLTLMNMFNLGAR